jgi:alpha-beta hydrolase superfamily lysophospholipase
VHGTSRVRRYDERVRRRIVVVLVIGLASWALSGLAAAYALTRRTHARTVETPEGDPPFVSLRLRTSDGLAIGAWLAERDTDPVAVVLVHGHGASRSAVIEEARALWSAGASVMPISMRAHGDSDGDVDDLGWSARHDVEAAVLHLHEARPDRRIVVLGYSAGAAAAIDAAEALGDRVAGWVLVAPYADLALATRHRTQRYLPPGIEWIAYAALRLGALVVFPDLDRMRPIDHAGALAAPSLFVAGGADDRAPESEVRAIAARASDARTIVVPGLQHEQLGELVARPEWEAIVALVRREGE